VIDDGIIQVKALLSSVLMVGVGSTYDFNGVTVPLTGVPLTAVIMAGAGAVCAFAWPREATTRVMLFSTVAASTLVGSTAASIVPQLFGMEWPEPLQAPLAFMLGLITPWVIPPLQNAIPSIVAGLKSALIRLAGGKE